MAGQVRVLVVDDDTEVREALVSTLQAHGYNVYSASSGRLAAELVEEQLSKEGAVQVDVVVSDYVMHDQDGVELLAKLQDPKYGTIPFILMSGVIDPETLAFAQRLGAAGVLPKPFRPSELFDLIDKTVKRD